MSPSSCRSCNAVDVAKHRVTFLPADLTVEVEDGTSILDAALNHGVELEHNCGGNCACSTCHVIVDPAWFGKLPEAVEEEEDMLDLAFGLTHTSRLGCQIRLTSELDGLVVRVPGEHLDMRGR